MLRAMVLASAICAICLAVPAGGVLQETSAQTKPLVLPKVAIYPWSFSENEGGTNARGVERSQALLTKLFTDRAGMDIVSASVNSAAWQRVSGDAWRDLIEDPKDQPAVPDSKKLLEFGKLAGADFVCAGRLRWNVKSKWVGLGPKIRVTAYVDVKIVDVKKSEEVLNVVDFDSNTGAAEKWWQSAGSLLLTWGFTLFSGGPKTPHMERSAIKAIGGATDPFFTANRAKITAP